MELSRLYPEGLLTVEGSYSQFLERKADFLSAQEQLQQTLANKARRELEWLRRGAKARTRKSQARIDAAGRLMASLDEVRSRNVQQTAVVDFTSSNRKTKRLLTLRNVAMRVGARSLFQELSITLSPGDKLGLLGQNGSGKTTLLNILGTIDLCTHGTVGPRRPPPSSQSSRNSRPSGHIRFHRYIYFTTSLGKDRSVILVPRFC